jgi:hypothetical protein
MLGPGSVKAPGSTDGKVRGFGRHARDGGLGSVVIDEWSRSLLVPSSDDHDRTVGVLDALLADRSEQ